MASRFYFEQTIVSLSGVTTIDGTWDTDSRSVTQGTPGRTFNLLPSGTAPTTTSYATLGGLPSLASPLPRHTLHAMYQYSIPAGLLITGNVRGEFAGFRTNNADNIQHNLAVHIRNGTTHKATVAQVFTASNFYGFDPGHVQAMASRPVIDDGYITVAGDILYAELGLGWSATPQAQASVTVGYNNTGAHVDWNAGDDGIADTDESNAAHKNTWFEFETTLASAPAADDFLPTLSATSVTARPSSPSKPGLHFYDRTNHVLSIWDGSTWTNMASAITIGGVTVGGIIGFSSTFGVSVTLTGNTVTWDAQALSVSGSRSKTLALTDDGTEGALLTAANTFGVNAAAIMAPNATNALRIGKFGNISVAGTALLDTDLCRFQKSDFNTGVSPRAINCAITNTNSGNATASAMGIQIAATASMTGTTSPSTNPVIGIQMSVGGGSAGNSYFQAAVVGILMAGPSITGQTTSQVIPSITGFQFAASPLLTRVNVTDVFGCRVGAGATLLTSATVTNYTGYRCNAITAGSSRFGLDIASFTTGTPSISTGIRIAAHTVGTTKRSITAGDSIESSKYVIAGVSGFGCVVQDTADGNFYSIFTTNGFIQAASLGATMPAS